MRTGTNLPKTYTGPACRPDHAEFQSVLKYSPRPWYLHADAAGNILCVSPHQRKPTREELIQGVMALPRYTRIGRHADGTPKHDVHVFTRAEAEADVDASIARWPGLCE